MITTKVVVKGKKSQSKSILNYLPFITSIGNGQEIDEIAFDCIFGQERM